LSSSPGTERPLPGAYVHVPYCATRCSYCSFTAIAGREGEGDYFQALLEEIDAREGEVPGPLETIYFGGGTPSYVEPARLSAILSALADTFGLAPGAEVTAEANPDDVTDERLAALRALGVNRLSIGVQSLVDTELVYLERRHDGAAALAALRRAVAVFPSVSADLMLGIPGQTLATLRGSLEGVLATGVRHLSAYILELEKAPKLVSLKERDPELFADDEEVATRWEMVDELAEAAELPRYEMSNWAAPGHESRHNLKYWREEPTLGFGVSAHSFDGAARRANSGSTLEYARRVRATGTAFVSATSLPAEDAAREKVLLGLRLGEGVDERSFERAAAGLAADDRVRLAEREEAGLLVRGDGRIRLTRRGVLLSNEVFALLV
jgi:oxygen-independent coproporphyrinogen III oxidase